MNEYYQEEKIICPYCSFIYENEELKDKFKKLEVLEKDFEICCTECKKMFRAYVEVLFVCSTTGDCTLNNKGHRYKKSKTDGSLECVDCGKVTWKCQEEDEVIE